MRIFPANSMDFDIRSSIKQKQNFWIYLLSVNNVANAEKRHVIWTKTLPKSLFCCCLLWAMRENRSELTKYSPIYGLNAVFRPPSPIKLKLFLSFSLSYSISSLLRPPITNDLRLWAHCYRDCSLQTMNFFVSTIQRKSKEQRKVRRQNW